MNYEKIYTNGYEHSNKFMDFSKWIVKNNVATDPRNSHLTAEALEGIVEVLAIDMAIGSELKKNKYIITGVIIGGLLTAGVIILNNKLREGRD